jgi:predicted DsbA family dithiol-disulfide isomerase
MTKTKKLIRIDITSDTVCPWCFVGKKYLEKAMEQVKDQYEFEVRWHPFQLNPKAPKVGVEKLEFYKKKFGDARIAPILDRISKVFADLGMKFSAGGKIGNTFDSHRLLELAGRQDLGVQNKLAEELFVNYFTQEKYIGDK